MGDNITVLLGAGVMFLLAMIVVNWVILVPNVRNQRRRKLLLPILIIEYLLCEVQMSQNQITLFEVRVLFMMLH